MSTCPMVICHGVWGVYDINVGLEAICTCPSFRGIGATSKVALWNCPPPPPALYPEGEGSWSFVARLD